MIRWIEEYHKDRIVNGVECHHFYEIEDDWTLEFVYEKFPGKVFKEETSYVNKFCSGKVNEIVNMLLAGELPKGSSVHLYFLDGSVKILG